MVTCDIEDRSTGGKDFNAFLLAQKEEKKKKQASDSAIRFMIKQVQLMHRVALLRIKLHYVITKGMRDQNMRQKYESSHKVAKKEYDEVMQVTKTIQKKIIEMDKHHTRNLDLNKIN